jgi:WD40 repeat protein
VALDTSEKDRLEAQMEVEKLERRRLEESLAQSNLSSQVLRAELETLRTEISRLKKRKFPQNSSDPTLIPQRSPFKFLRRAILGHGPAFQCRAVAFDPHYGIFLVSRSDGDQIGGVVKVSLWDASGSEFVALHEGHVRAIACSPRGDGLFLTCGTDDRLKLSTMSSNSVLQTWKLASSPWSCAFHPDSINHVAVGLSAGQIAIFDLRQPITTPPKIFQSPQKSNYPVHSVNIVKIENDFILVGATMEGPFSIAFSEDQTVDNWVSDFGYKNFACTSLSIDPLERKMFLASFRSVPPREPSRHVIFELEFQEENERNLKPKLPFSEFKSSCEGPNKIPFRSSLICTAEITEFFIPDETDYTVQCHQLASIGSPSEILSTNAGIPIIETCLGKVGKAADEESSTSTIVIGILTSKHLYIYTTQ